MTTDATLTSDIEEARACLEKRLGGQRPQVMMILGSGLNPVADAVSDAVDIPFAEIPHMMTSTASGHVGRFVAGKLGGRAVLAMQGRLHGYEGYTAQEVALPVWVAAALGVRVLVTTNAAGAVNPSFQVGDFCLMSDQINMTGRNPVAGIAPDRMAPRFFSMEDAYDPALRALARSVAVKLGFSLREGVYLGLLGPSFETPAEIRAFRTWGADTVAMSVCEEVIAARHVGLRVLGISLITNMACGVAPEDPTDEDVFAQATARVPDFCRLLAGVVAGLDVPAEGARLGTAGARA